MSPGAFVIQVAIRPFSHQSGVPDVTHCRSTATLELNTAPVVPRRRPEEAGPERNTDRDKTSSMRGRGSHMQAREIGAAAQTDSSSKGNPGTSSFKSKKPLAVIATPDLDLWGQLGPMLESHCS